MAVDTVTSEDIDRWRTVLEEIEHQVTLKDLTEAKKLLAKLDDELFERWSSLVVRESR
jgi:hypothetical protein